MPNADEGCVCTRRSDILLAIWGNANFGSGDSGLRLDTVVTTVNGDTAVVGFVVFHNCIMRPRVSGHATISKIRRAGWKL